MSKWETIHDDFIGRRYDTDEGETHLQYIYISTTGEYHLSDVILNKNVNDATATFYTMAEAKEVADGWKSMENRV